MDIRAIIFDVGGVLTKSQHHVVLQHIAGHHHNFAEIQRFHDENWPDVNMGEMEASEFYEELIARFHIKKSLKEIQSYYEMLLQPIPGTWQLAHKLKGKYVLAILSNMCHEYEEIREEHFPFKEIFHPRIWSSDVQEIKPHKNMYEHMLSLLELPAGSCVFIDDHKENVDAAEAVGMRGIVFENPEQLEKELHKLGVEISRIK